MGYGGSKEEYYNDRTISSEKQSNSAENPENAKSDFISKGMDVFNDAYSYGESDEEKKGRQIKSMANLLSGTYFSEKGLSYDLCEAMAKEIVNNHYQDPNTTKILESARETIEYFSSDDFQINSSGGDTIFNKFISGYPQFSTYDENAKLEYILEIPNSFIGGRQALIKNYNAIKSWQNGVTEGFRNHGYNEDFIKQSLLILLNVDNRSLKKEALDNFFMEYWDPYENTTDSTENGKNETSGVTNGMNELYLKIYRAISNLSSLKRKLKDGSISYEKFIEGISKYEKDEDIVRYYTNKCKSSVDDNTLIIFGVLTRKLTGSNFTPSEHIELSTNIREKLVLTAKKHNEEIQEHNDSIKAILHDLDNFSIEDYVAKFEEAHKIAEVRQTYGDMPIILDSNPNKDSNNPSGQQIASELLQGKDSTVLNSFKIHKASIDSKKDTSLRYSAFDITFNNLFNQNNPIVQKLISQKIDLRSEMSNYGIYNFENGFLNSKARDKFVSEKLQNGVLSEDELRKLGETIKELPTNVDNNYNILCGNFYTDQEGFEKIAKIHALGEVIENIKKLFEKVENINTPNLGKLVGLELDKEKPAEIIGDCLFLKGKSNGNDINIKYDLSSGKLFMNSFLQKSYDKINIGNTQPNTQIGSIDSFEDILNGYNLESFIQPTENSNSTDNEQQSKEESNSNQIVQGKLKKLSENKLLQNLGKIGEIVGKKAEIQSQKNSAIINFLKSFNIGFNSGELRNLDFNKESNLYDVLQIIDDSADITSDDTDIGSIKYFNNVFMPKIMKYSGLKWGESNQYGRQRTEENQNEYDYTFDEKNSNKQASLLRKDSENFSINPQKFTETLNYGADYQLGFANIINSGEITVGELPKRKLNQEKMRTFMSNLEHDRESYDWLSKNLETVSTDDGQIN